MTVGEWDGFRRSETCNTIPCLCSDAGPVVARVGVAESPAAQTECAWLIFGSGSAPAGTDAKALGGSTETCFKLQKINPYLRASATKQNGEQEMDRIGKGVKEYRTRSQRFVDLEFIFRGDTNEKL